MMTSQKFQTSLRRRQGNIMVLLVVILPVLVVLCAMAVNLAQIQLARTELKIATDAAARAGGRAWSNSNDHESAIDFALLAAEANNVQGAPLDLTETDIEFGNSERDGEDGRFVFVPNPNESEAELTTALRVNSTVNNTLAFQISGINSIQQQTSTVASQVDRDIALVVDRSGSMAYFEDEDFLFNEITRIHEAHGDITNGQYTDAVADYQGVNSLAKLSLNSREYSDNVINRLTGDLREYAQTVNSDYRKKTRAPRQSRWAVLEQATAAFFDTLEESSSNERVSISSFASKSSLDLPMTHDLELAKQTVLDLYPTGSTAIGLGMETAVIDLLGDARRASAIPTILIFSDGENKKNPTPTEVATNIITANPNVIINTVTFADGDQTEMAAVAEIGNGIHYHANDGEALIDVFREIAKSFSTVITE